MTFMECVIECSKNEEFVKEFDRFHNTHLSSMTKRKPIETMIDEATGRDDAALAEFVNFVHEYVWLRLV